MAMIKAFAFVSYYTNMKMERKKNAPPQMIRIENDIRLRAGTIVSIDASIGVRLQLIIKLIITILPFGPSSSICSPNKIYYICLGFQMVGATTNSW